MKVSFLQWNGYLYMMFFIFSGGGGGDDPLLKAFTESVMVFFKLQINYF